MAEMHLYSVILCFPFLLDFFILQYSTVARNILHLLTLNNTHKMDDLIYPHHRRHYHYHYDLRHIAQWATKKITLGGGDASMRKRSTEKNRKAPKKESEREWKIKQATGLAHRLARAINQCSTASRFVSSLALMP